MADTVADRVQKQLETLRDVDWQQYTSQEEEDASSLSFFSGLLLGLIVGVIVAILLAPQSGSDTREQVAQTGIELLPASPDDMEKDDDEDLTQPLLP